MPINRNQSTTIRFFFITCFYNKWIGNIDSYLNMIYFAASQRSCDNSPNYRQNEIKYAVWMCQHPKSVLTFVDCLAFKIDAKQRLEKKKQTLFTSVHVYVRYNK